MSRTATVVKRFTFDAAHQLPNHDGKCARPHGHTYTVDVFASGQINEAMAAPDEGMVLDFGRIKAVWKTDLEPYLDHQDLNETFGASGAFPNECWPTTAENLACWLLGKFNALLPAVKRVRVWETPTSYADVHLGDLEDVPF